MKQLSFYLDTRSGKETFPIKIRITHNGSKAYVGLGIKIAPEDWNKEENKVAETHPKAKQYNSFLTSKMSIAESILIKCEIAGKLNQYSATQLKELIENNGETIEKKNTALFVDFYMRCIDQKKKSKTALSYQTALKRMCEFDPMLSEKTFDDIDLKYIQRLDAWFEDRNVSINARAVYYRNIRSVFNDAIDEGLTTNYPFRLFKIKKTPTKKRNLSVEELRMLRDYPIVNEFQQKYRDIFMLCFYLRGINAVDLFGLKKSNIRLGRINYIRSKTGKPYSVKIEPEAKALLDKYKGKDYLIDVCDGAKTKKEFDGKYEGFLQRMDRGLKKIGPYTRSGLGGKKKIDPILPFLSQYWCRHTCATLMDELGYSNEIIACSLGHEHGNPTTNIYIEYNEKKVDEANRALIDYVNKK